MENNRTNGIVDQFQHAFARIYEDQIQQLIRDSRAEALAQAKQILREKALNNVLEAVVDGTVEKGAPVPDIISSEVVSSEVVTVKPIQKPRRSVKPESVSRSKETRNAPPVLNDRILEEIEAIREQIRRNELLLSQIKPFVQTSKVQEE